MYITIEVKNNKKINRNIYQEHYMKKFYLQKMQSNHKTVIVIQVNMHIFNYPPKCSEILLFCFVLFFLLKRDRLILKYKWKSQQWRTVSKPCKRNEGTLAPANDKTCR